MRRLLQPTRLSPIVKWTSLAVGLLAAAGCGASGAATTVAEGGSVSSDAGGSSGAGGQVINGGASQVNTSIGNGGTGGVVIVVSTGGSNSAGGNRGTGGVPISTGGKANGGALSTGGARTGGNNAVGTGGNRVTTGGMPATGGLLATGGLRPNTGGSPATGGTTSSSTLNPPITGSDGYATRYWDCCKPSCSWTTALPSCQKDGTTRISDRNATSGCDNGGSAFECFDFSPWYDASTNLSYGFVAYNAASCGACYELQFKGTSQYGVNNGAINIKGKQMIVQAINIGNIAAGQFDLLVPGGGIGAMPNGCPSQLGSIDLGATNGGLLTECNLDPTCMANKCASSFAGKAGLLAGCNWFTGWFSSADNPQLIYKQVSCPSQITSKSGISG